MSTAFVDLSGAAVPHQDGNPYDALIDACEDEPEQIQIRYEVHRTTRNSQQKSAMLDPGFPGLNIDQTLCKLYYSPKETPYVDPRHCLVFWARPPASTRKLIANIQQEMRSAAPNLWLMPADHLHMTVLEITHSKTEQEIAELVKQLQVMIPSIVDHTLEHRARLVKPIVSYDNSAVALSFLPAAGEETGLQSSNIDDRYTYHHLRKDIYQLCSKSGVSINSRYVVPSAHLTIGRFITPEDFSKQPFDRESPILEHTKLKAWIELLESVNSRIKRELWPDSKGKLTADGGEWVIGQEKGLDCRFGTLWYGGGQTIQLGQGF